MSLLNFCHVRAATAAATKENNYTVTVSDKAIVKRPYFRNNFPSETSAAATARRHETG